MARKTKEVPSMAKNETKTEETTLHVGDMVYDMATFNIVANGTKSDDKFGVVKAGENLDKLVELGLVQVNPAGPDEDGNVQAVLTDRGREADAYNEANPGETEKKTRRKSDVVTPDAVVSDDVVPMPTASRRGREGKYPFDKLDAVGKSFHIECTKETQNEILGRMHSSVGTANTRYEAQDIRFNAKAVGENDPLGLGVRVWRVEPLTAEEKAKRAGRTRKKAA